MHPPSTPDAPQPAPTQQPPTRTNRKLWIVVGALAVCGILVIPCLGITAAVAIPAFGGYGRRSKTAEAHATLAALASAERAYCEEHGAYLAPAGPVPPSPGALRVLGDFAGDPTFAELGFSPPEPVYFRYAIERDARDPQAIRLVAQGDLDGDGNLSTFARRCGPACTCAEAAEVSDETE